MLHLSIAAASTVALAPAAAEPAPDAELIALGREFDAALARYFTAAERVLVLNDAVTTRTPPWPEAVKVKRWDHALLRGRLSFHRGVKLGEEYSERDISALMNWKPHRTVFRRVESEGQVIEKYMGYKPFVRAQKRVDEIIAAIDARAAAIEAIENEVGLPAANKNEDDADDALWVIIDAATASSPQSLAGLAVKAKVADYVYRRFGNVGDSADERLIHSLMADIARLGGSDPARPASTAPADDVEMLARDFVA